jgi:Xaa-Pro aminopeptidase
VTTTAHWIPNRVLEDRIAALQAWLAGHGFDAYAVTGVENVAYLSGWRPDVEPWERPILLVVPRDGRPAMVLHELSVHAVRMARERGTLVVQDVSFYVERPRVGSGTWSRSHWGERSRRSWSSCAAPPRSPTSVRSRSERSRGPAP